MNNLEKQKYIKEMHKLYTELRPYSDGFSLDQMKEEEEILWFEYLKSFHKLVPEKFYKYRRVNEENLNCLLNERAWFSKPVDFGDIVDSSINTDINAELDDFEKNKSKYIKRFSAAIINCMLAPYGQKVDENMVDEIMPLFNSNGEVLQSEVKKFLESKMPEYASDKYSEQLANSTKIDNQEPIFELLKGFLMTYLDFNSKIRNNMFVFSLAEENDNLAMWETYADGAKGFCVEYQFPKELFLAQRILLNLLPIYYGEKERINFFDVLINGLSSKQNINGIAFDDYSKWFLSSYTKDSSYEFQKEWRITFTEEMGGNKQYFPFAKAIILGEKMADEDKSKLINIAKNKKLKVYKRKLNISGSKVIMEEISI
jgi:hypothetical protein